MDQIQQLFNNSMPIFANCKSLACYRWDKRNEIKADARPTPFRPIWSNFNGSTTHINDDANGLAFYIHNQYGMLRPTDLFHIFLFSSLFSRFEINAIEIYTNLSVTVSACKKWKYLFLLIIIYGDDPVVDATHFRWTPWRKSIWKVCIWKSNHSTEYFVQWSHINHSHSLWTV